MLWRFRFTAAVALGLMVAQPAVSLAADPASWWSGFYAGAHVGGLAGKTNFSDPAGPALWGGDVVTPGFVGGVQLGYDWAVAPRWLAGAELGASLASAHGSMTCMQSSSTIISSDCQVRPRAFATLTGRLGWLADPRGRLLLYGKGGLAWMTADANINPNNSYSFARAGNAVDQRIDAFGWTLGAGLEYALDSAWSLGVDYGYLRFDGIRMPKPATVDVDLDGGQSNVSGSSSALTFSQHLVKLAVNYRWGVRSATTSDADRQAWAAQDRGSWMPGWEFDLGTRYWYSFGTFRNSNGAAGTLVSRLTYDEMHAHSGELFARLDSPFNVFVKAVAGGGFIASGAMNDEDWAANNVPPVSYTNTRHSPVTGSLNFFTVDLGYNLWRGPDHKVGLFVGYNRFQIIMSSFGCVQIANPGSGFCSTPADPAANAISELDTWQSFRVGSSAEVRLSDRFALGGDVAFLPLVRYDGLDIHHARQPPAYFPVTGTGQGVQAELLLSYRATEALSLGVGGRYWAWWTTDAEQTNASNSFDVSMERYGVFLQASYKFQPRR